MNATYKATLDNMRYDSTDNTIKVNGVAVVTQDDLAIGDIDFSNMF